MQLVRNILKILFTICDQKLIQTQREYHFELIVLLNHFKAILWILIMVLHYLTQCAIMFGIKYKCDYSNRGYSSPPFLLVWLKLAFCCESGKEPNLYKSPTVQSPRNPSPYSGNQLTESLFQLLEIFYPSFFRMCVSKRLDSSICVW